MNTETLLIAIVALLAVGNAMIVACLLIIWRRHARDQATIHSFDMLARDFTHIADSWNKTAEAWKQLGETGAKVSEHYQVLHALLQTQMRSVEQFKQISHSLERIQSSEMESAERQVHHFSELVKRFETAIAESRYRDADMLRDALSSFLSQQSSIQREGASQMHSEVQELGQFVHLLVEKLGQISQPERSEQEMHAGGMAAQKEQERIYREQGNLNRLQAVIGNQAELLYASGDLTGAVARLKEQEAICRRLGNADGLMRALNNQAIILHVTGNLREAMSVNQEVESIIRRTLAQSERQFGSEHPDTLMSLTNLAESLERKGDYAQAEMLYRHVMVASERMFGPEHASTRVSCEGVARARAHSGKSAPEAGSSGKPPDKIIGAMHELRTPEVPTHRIDKVHFSVASPPSAQPGKKFFVDVWAHLEQQRAEVERRVQQARPQTDPAPVIRPKGPFKIERGTTLLVRLKFPDLHVEPSQDVILWEGEIGNACFEVAIPSETPEGVICGLVTVHWEGGFQIARVPLQVRVAANANPAASTTQPIHHIRKAFASYASPDREAVLGRIQGMQKIAPDLDVFLDVVKLRSGEDWEKKLWQVIPESDVFYLFWSAAAKASPWVEKEWKCALSSRGEEFIDPVPLVSPEEVRPPDELSKKHFNDWILAFRRGQPSRSERGGLVD